MSIEGIENSDAEKTVIVEALRDKGIEDESTRELLIAWVEKKEKELESITDVAEHREAQIKFEVERAQLYADAGFMEEAPKHSMMLSLLQLKRADRIL